METTTNHLNKKTLAVLDKSDQERIQYACMDHWIPYEEATKYIDDLNFLVTMPIKNRPPSRLLIGRTNNGKSEILRQFQDQHPATINTEDDFLQMPVLSILCPPIPNQRTLYNAILDQIRVPHRHGERIEKKDSQVLNALTKLKVKVLVIDEINTVINATISKRSEFLNVIKYLSNKLKISIVVAGTEEASLVITTNSHLANRFKPLILYPWDMSKEYLRLLKSFERHLPLREPSNLTDEHMATTILSMTEGVIGEISKLLEMAVIYCINKGFEKISIEILTKIEWASPADRRSPARVFKSK